VTWRSEEVLVSGTSLDLPLSIGEGVLVSVVQESDLTGPSPKAEILV